MPRNSIVSAGKRERRLIDGAIDVEGIDAVCGNHVRSGSESTAFFGHEGLNGFAAQAVRIHHVAFDRDPIQLPRFLGRRIRKGQARLVLLVVFEQFSAHLLRDWCALQLFLPRINEPHAWLLPKFRSKVKPDWALRIFETVSQRNFWRRAIPLLIFELAPVQADGLKESRHGAVRQWHLEMICALRPHDALAIHHELIPLGLSPKYRMIVENHACELRAGVRLEKHRCGKAADSSANHYTIEYFVGVNCVLRQ